MSEFVPEGLGWLPDLPDARDYTPWHDEVLPLLSGLRPSPRSAAAVVDLRCDGHGEYFSAPPDQGPLNCSCACAALSLVEYFERRGRGRTFEGSQRFLYKVTRNRIHKRWRVSGDTGADLRTTLKALVQFGVPPEEYWPVNIDSFDDEPSAFVYSPARRHSCLRYFRLDAANRDGSATLRAVKSFLAAGFPVAFGFSVPSSLTRDAEIPYRPQLDSPRGGQAAIAVGYSDNHPGSTKLALLVRLSWGMGWGISGYGWLPCAYVQNQLALNFWTLLSEEWLDRNEFWQPSVLTQPE